MIPQLWRLLTPQNPVSPTTSWGDTVASAPDSLPGAEAPLPDDDQLADKIARFEAAHPTICNGRT